MFYLFSRTKRLFIIKLNPQKNARLVYLIILIIKSQNVPITISFVSYSYNNTVYAHIKIHISHLY